MNDRASRIVRDGASFRAEPWLGPAPAEGWAEAFALYASEDPSAPAMLGGYAIEGQAVVFTPRFVPAPALRLRAEFRPQGAAPVTAWFGGIPVPPRAPTTRIVGVTPSADVWPENVLKLYVTFSAPMRIGVAWDHIRVLDGEGRAMGGMFVEIDQELWDPQGRRLTVLFDPARIKRGLVDHINEGPPLVRGERYTLEIDAMWRDAAGGLLAEGFSKTITVELPRRDPLDPAAWRLTPPSGPDAPLAVDVPFPLDAALAARAFTVLRRGAAVACETALERDETRIVLTPASPWAAGAYALAIDPVLEDIAGNRIGRPFDIDTLAGGAAAAHGAELAFEV